MLHLASEGIEYREMPAVGRMGISTDDGYWSTPATMQREFAGGVRHAYAHGDSVTVCGRPLDGLHWKEFPNWDFRDEHEDLCPSCTEISSGFDYNCAHGLDSLWW